MSDVDRVLEEIVGRIAEMECTGEHDDQNVQWDSGYRQACVDITLMICRKAKALKES